MSMIEGEIGYLIAPLTLTGLKNSAYLGRDATFFVASAFPLPTSVADRLTLSDSSITYMAGCGAVLGETKGGDRTEGQLVTFSKSASLPGSGFY